VLVPSLMTMFGKANWWMPAWLANALPKISVEEGGDEIIEDEPLDDADPDAIGDRERVGV